MKSSMWTKYMLELAKRLDVRDEEGQTVVEYSLILVLISVVAIAIMATVGGDVTGVFTDVSNALTP